MVGLWIVAAVSGRRGVGRLRGSMNTKTRVIPRPAKRAEARSTVPVHERLCRAQLLECEHALLATMAAALGAADAE